MAKTITFAIMHFSVAFGVAYAITGSVIVGGAVALIEPAINTFAFHIHEKVWSKLQHENGTTTLEDAYDYLSDYAQAMH